MDKTGLIYIIRNRVNDKVYIGQTTSNVETRLKQHFKNSVMKSRHYKIYNAIKKYGKENFYIDVLEDDIPIELLDQKEIKYIESFNSFEHGYNSTKGGDGRTINKPYDEKDIICLYQSGLSMNKIAEKYNVSRTTIGRLLKRKRIKARHDGNKYESFVNFELLWNQKIKINDMAEIYGVNEKTIRRNAKRLGLRRYTCI